MARQDSAWGDIDVDGFEILCAAELDNLRILLCRLNKW